MNGKNKILIGCLALLLVMSIGYALFSDTITINGTATAKGNFQLTTTCDMDTSAIESTHGPRESGLITNSNISCEDNVVDASAMLGSPGSLKWFRIIVENTGTIPAKLKKISELNNPDMFIDKENYTNTIWTSASNNDKTNRIYVELFPNLSFFEDYNASEEGWGTDIIWYEEQFDAVLDPGEKAYFYIRMLWDSNSTTPGEPLTASLKAQMDWEQVTE